MSLYNEDTENRYKNNYDKKSIIVIGGGPSGILSVRYLSQEDQLNVICFEGKDNLGGMWYLDKYDALDGSIVDQSKNAFINDIGVVQSSLYESLDLNNPKGLSLYKGFPIPKENKEYMTQEENLKYLHNFADHFNVRSYTSFHSYVNFVRLTANMTQQELQNIPFVVSKKFLVEVVSYHNFEQDRRYFQADYILASSGHFSKPNVYPIPNQEIFEGRILHTHHFRQADEQKFANKNIVIISSMISAQDIYSILLFKTRNPPAKITVVGRQSVEYLQKATSLQEIIHSGRLEFIQDEYSKINSKNSIEFKSGNIIENVDVILLATGYQYCFPYLDKFNHIDNLIEYYEKSRSFGPLYNKIISINEPHLMFPGCCNGVNQSTYERQVIYMTQFIIGKFSLPSKEEMMKDFEEDVQRCGSKKVYLAVARFPRFTTNNEYYPRKLLKDLKDIEFDSEYQEIWVKVAKIAETHMGEGNYYQMKQEDLGYIFPSEYAPKLGAF